MWQVIVLSDDEEEVPKGSFAASEVRAPRAGWDSQAELTFK